MLGTPYYMSPEQAQGIKAVDARSDLWSLAVIVFQALTGKLPFESEALGDLLVRIIVAPVPMPSQFVSDLPQSFDRWWEKASQRDPAGRFQSAREFGDSLAMAFGHSKGLSGEGMARPDGGRRSRAPATTPASPGPFGNTPHPGFGNTAESAVRQTPHPLRQHAAALRGHPAAAGRWGPRRARRMSRTFDAPPSARPKGKGTLVAIGGLSVVVLALADRSARPFALKSKEAPAASAAAASALRPER